jgi:hypothetical protein
MFFGFDLFYFTVCRLRFTFILLLELRLCWFDTIGPPLGIEVWPF